MGSSIKKALTPIKGGELLKRKHVIQDIIIAGLLGAAASYYLAAQTQQGRQRVNGCLA